MLNGKYDHFFPVEASQKPMFRLLGAQPEPEAAPLLWTGRSIVGRYGVALLLAAAALVATLLFRDLISPSMFIFIYVAVTASAAYGGFGPAALASVVSVFSADVWLIGPFGLPSLDEPGSYLRLATLLTGAGITSFLNAAQRKAGMRATTAAEAWRRAEEDATALARSLEAEVLANRQNETRLQLAIESARMVAWQWDPKSDQVTMSKNVREVFGVDHIADSTAGFALIHPDDRERHRERVSEALGAKRPYQSEFRIIKPDTGALVWLEERAAPVLDASGELIRLVGIVTDVTARREATLERERLLDAERLAHQQAEAKAVQLERLTVELRATNRDLDQFAYIASHDLKAPLRGIANLTQWIEEDLGERITGQATEHMRLLTGRVHRMEALIEGILKYSRAGRVRGSAEPVDVRLLLEEAVELLGLPDTARVTWPNSLPVVAAVPVQLEQVFLNLIGNAVKHARGNAIHVEILWRDLGDRHEFAVRDDGPGIAEQYHERIWDLFQTLEARDKIEGAGIGLSVVRRIVEALGGAVWLESEVDRGSTFYFTWLKSPRATSQAGESWKTES